MKLRLLFFLLLPIVASAQKTALDAKPGTIVIKGKLGKLNPPAQLWVYMGEEKWDTIVVKDGAFEYRKTTQLPAYGAMMIKYKPYYQGVKSSGGFFSDMDLKSLFFESGTMLVSSPVDSLKKKARFTGSKIQEEQEAFLKKKALIREREKVIAARFNQATPAQMQSEAYLQAYELQSSGIQKSLDSLIATQIGQSPGSFVSQMAFLEHLRTTESTLSPEVANDIFEKFPVTFRESTNGKNALASIANLGKPKTVIKVPEVGEQAPAFVQNSPEDKAVSLKDFSGKYVLIDFWASWCVPCRKVNPDLVRLFRKHKGERFSILGVSLDEDKAKWLAAIAQDKLDWKHVSDLKGWDNAVSKMYGIQGIPQNILVDPSGKIVAKNLSIPDLDAKLLELLKRI